MYIFSQEDLFRLLKAYTVYNPIDGYCQAQAPLAAILLMHMPAEEAFWCFVSICEKYLPGYYSVGLVCMDFKTASVAYGRVSPLGVGGCWFDPWPGYTKFIKNGSNGFPSLALRIVMTDLFLSR